MAPMFLRGLKGGISCASPTSLATCSTVDYPRAAAVPGHRNGRRSYERPSDTVPAPHLKDAHRSKSVNSAGLFPASKPPAKSRGKLRKPAPPPPPPPLPSPGSSTRYLLNGGGGDDDDEYSYFDSLDGYLESDLSPSLIPVIDPSRFRTEHKGDEFSRSFSTPARRPSQWPRPREERRVAFLSASTSASASSSSTTSSSNSDITIGGTSVAGRNSSAGGEGTWVRFQTVNSGEESAVLQPSSFRKSSVTAREELVGIRGAPPGGEQPVARCSPVESGSLAGKQLLGLPGHSISKPSSASAVSVERHHVDKAAEAGAPAALKPSSCYGPGDQVMTLRVSIHCKGCEAKVRKHLSKMQGVKSFNIEFAAKKVTVVGNVTPLALLSSISKVKNAQFWPEPPLATI